LADEAKSLSHIGAGDAPAMVDVSAKATTLRVARAEARLRFPAEAFRTLQAQGFATAKGPVFHTAIVAGTMAAKRTHELIPFCHPLALERCDVTVVPEGDGIVAVSCTAAVHGRTGVEMEALTGASVAALTVYDMCKSLSHAIVVESLRLVEKSGGKSGFAAGPPP
jgi:cyclic pyranopterin monophosphate synthase